MTITAKIKNNNHMVFGKDNKGMVHIVFLTFFNAECGANIHSKNKSTSIVLDDNTVMCSECQTEYEKSLDK